MDLDQIKALDKSLTKDYPFDYYCWDLYTKVGLFYRDGSPAGNISPEKAKLRTDVLHANVDQCVVVKAMTEVTQHRALATTARVVLTAR